MVIVNDFPTNAEYFRVIDGFPSYEVSTDGRVRNSKTGRIMKLYIRPTGYIQVSLSKDKQISLHYVHRLVATAFCIKTDDYNVVDHIDRNSSNNNYKNLRWTTLSGNLRNRTIAMNNTSGFAGVSYNKYDNSWTASWRDENNKLQHKYFSVNKYGDEQSKHMAINHRKKMADANGYLNV